MPMEPRLELDENRWRFFQRTLDLDDVLAQLLACHFPTITAIANVSIDTLTEIVVGEQEIAEEIRLRAREWLTSPRRTLSFYS